MSFKRFAPWVIFLLAVAVHCSFLASLKSGFLDGLFNDSTHRGGKGADFFQFYQSGHNLLHGKSIYKIDYADIAVPYFYPNHYPPFVAATLGIATNLFSEPWSAYGAWVVVIEVMLLSCLVATRVFCTTRADFLLASAMWLAFSPYYLDLYLGQTNTLMAFLLFFMIFFSKRERGFLSGLLYVSSVLVKLLTLLFVPLWLRLKGYRLVLCTLLAIIGTMAPYFFVFDDEMGFFFKWVLGLNMPLLFNAGNFGFLALLYSLVSFQGLIPLVSGAIGATSLFITFSPRGSRDLLCLAALWMCTYFLAYKFVWEHHYVMLLPFLVLLFAHKKLNSSFILLIYLLLAIPSPFAFLDVKGLSPLDDPQPRWTACQSFLYHASKITPVMLLYIALTMKVLKKKGGTSFF